MSMDKFVNSLTDEQKQALLEALMGGEPQEVPKKQPSREVKDSFIVNTKKVQGQSNVQNNKRREPVRGRENRWEDTGEFRDIETPDVERTPRRRAPPRKVDVECASCGKSFKVDSRFVYGEYYRCNRCGSKR